MLRLILSGALLSWARIATAESAPSPGQWSAPAPQSATATPPASAPPTSLSPAPAVPASGPPPLPAPPGSPAGAPPAAPAPPIAPPPGAYPYPLYPAPPGYAYGYYYPPQYALPTPALRYPDNAAVSSTPFLDLLVGGVSWQNRFEQALTVGAQVGVYLGDRVRLTLRGAIPTDKLNDTYYGGAETASFLYGASAGLVVVDAKTFVLSPGVAIMRSDVSAYGSMIALSMPFEWVLNSGLRVGFELDLGRAVAGHTNAPPYDRPAGTGFWGQFQIGYGFNHPAPLPPASAPPAPPAPR